MRFFEILDQLAESDALDKQLDHVQDQIKREKVRTAKVKLRKQREKTRAAKN